MRYLQYLKEDVVSKALELGEPEVGGDYASEKVKRYISMIDAALNAMKSKEENDANDAVVSDLRDKKKKWQNVDKETKPVKVKKEEPPQQQQEEPPPEEEPPPQEEPPPKESILKQLNKYLNEAPKLNNWKSADNYTKDILYGAVYMRRYHGYDLTIINRDGKWIPVHGGTEMKPQTNPKKASLMLTKYVDSLPNKSKIIGDMG